MKKKFLSVKLTVVRTNSSEGETLITEAVGRIYLVGINLKKAYDENGRTLYKFSRSVAQGGNVYAHKGQISNKEGLKNALYAIAKKLDLIDSTVKVYNDIFFFFFHIPKSVAPAVLIDSIQKNIDNFSQWDEEYLFTGVYDLQKKCIRKDLQQWGYDFDKG